MKYYEKENVTIYWGDAFQELKSLPDESVDCCVTSPPYWGLRQYLFDNAIILRYNLTEDELKYVVQELDKYGVKPRQ